MSPVYLVLALQLSAPPEPLPLVRSTIRDQSVYTSGHGGSALGEFGPPNGGQLWIMKSTLATPTETTLFDSLVRIGEHPGALRRWQLVDGRLHFVWYGPLGGDSWATICDGILRTVPMAGIESVGSGLQRELITTSAKFTPWKIVSRLVRIDARWDGRRR